MSKKKVAIGVDVGGTGIKTAPVNVATGEFVRDRHRVLTPKPATPENVGRAIAASIARFKPKPSTPIGVAFPGAIKEGVVMTAANVDDSWIGADLRAVIKQHSDRDVFVLNDADAAGYGEYRFGAAHGRDGVVFLATLGTGIGTALIADGQLVPNTELGHVIIDGLDAEEYAADSARDRHGMDWDEWAPHVERYFAEMERLLWPDLMIVGGGVSKSAHMFLPKINLQTTIVPAELLNGAGIVGAAAAAYEAHKRAVKREKDFTKQERKDAAKAEKKAEKKAQEQA